MSKTLHDYLKATQRLIRDSRSVMIDFGDLIEYCNDARREIAYRAQCIRILTPSSGSVVSARIINPGSGYTAPVASISPPDFPSGVLPYPGGAPATAIAQQIGGVLSDIAVTFGGSGYFQPRIHITDPTGAGAEVFLEVSRFNTLNYQQEVYPFSGIDLSPFPGVQEIHSVLSVSVIFDNYRYMLPQYAFTQYQALVRQYPFQYTYVPSICSQYGQGAGGSLYCYPLPSQQYQMEWDCFCTPADLQDNLSVEALPDPWTDCVKFYAAHLAFLELQNFNSARAMLDLFTNQMQICSRAARPGKAVNPYGRY